MIHGEASRRRFLLATITYSGLVSTGIGAALLRASSAWAQSSDGNAGDLTRMARLLFPHDDIDDAVYAEVINSILTDAANPTLTIVALAIRQADHIAARMSRKEL